MGEHWIMRRILLLPVDHNIDPIEVKTLSSEVQKPPSTDPSDKPNPSSGVS